MKRTPRDRRYFFDLNHPADFHFFKNLFAYLDQQGYPYRVLARNKECLHELLQAGGIPFISRGKGSHFVAGKYVYAAYILILTLIQLIIFRPRLTLSLSSPYLISASRFLHIPTLTYDDTDFNPRLLPAIKRADYIFSPSNYPHTFHKNHFHIQTYKELAYLDPYIPRDEELGDAVFFRLTRTDSIHHSAGTSINVPWIIKEINRISDVHITFLSSETGIADDLSGKVLFPDRMKIHQDLRKCRVFWGNSATMAAEAVILGIPSIFVGSEKFAYLQELEGYGLLFCFPPDEIESSFNKLNELLMQSDAGKQFENTLARLLKGKINISDLIIWFIENLPDSPQILKDNEEIQFRFGLGISIHHLHENQ